jgi:ABC-type multidrug transport system fused ATPase/permease subunit
MGSDLDFDDLFTPVEEEPDQSFLKRNADSLFQSYKSQGLAIIGALTGSLPAFIPIAAVMVLVAWFSGAGTAGWKVVVVPYAVVVTLLTVSSADFLNKYRVEWRDLDNVVGDNMRKEPEQSQPLSELVMLLIAGLTFITLIAVGISIIAWSILASIAPSIGPVVAILLTAGIMFFERWLINEKEKSLSVTGMNLWRDIMKNTLYRSSKQRVALDQRSKFAKMVISGTVGGRISV